jgi:hypothetical protein
MARFALLLRETLRRPFHGASKRFVQTQTKAVLQGPTSPPLLEQTVAEHFRGIVKEHGNRIACVPRLCQEGTI